MIRVGLIVVLIAVFAAVVGPALTPYDPAAQELARRLEGPSLAHPFGLDELGRDILSRLLSGARISLLVGLAVVSVSSFFGMFLGSIAGYFGGVVDDAVSRVVDVLMAFPGILLAIALVAVLGPSLTNVVLALSIIGWVGYARLVRSQALRARDGASSSCRSGDARNGRRDHRRGLSQFPWLGRSAANTKLGHDAGCRPLAPVRCAAPDDLSRHGNRGPGAGVQLSGRRAQGQS